jgi:translocation and assembly module TamB
MRKTLKVGAFVLAGAMVALVAGTAAFTNSDWGREQIRTRVVSAIQGAANGNVSIGRLEGSLFKGLRVHDLIITDSTGAPFVSVREVRAGYSLVPLAFRKRIELRDVLLDHPVIVLERAESGKWNYERIFPVDSAGGAPSEQLQWGEWLVLHDVQMLQGSVTVRMPWRADSSLTGAKRDSAELFALSDESRVTVRRIDGRLQVVQHFDRMNGQLPLVRWAHPDYETRRIEADSLRMIALAFAPPAVDVRQARGAIELNADSVWFDDLELKLPASDATIGGRYTIENGDLALQIAARQVALADVRFVYPALPEEGSAKFDLGLLWDGDTQRYDVRGLDVTSGSARVQGHVGVLLRDTSMTYEQTNVTFSDVSTALIEQLVPTYDLPATGTLSGRAAINGDLLALDVDGDITFIDELSGRSRLIAVGRVGTSGDVISAQNLRLTFSPMQVALANNMSPDLPVGGTVTGRVTLNGASDVRLAFTGADLTHREGGARSRVTGSGGVRLGSSPFIDAVLQAAPVSLATVGLFAPAAGLRGDVTGPVSVRGPLRDLEISSMLRAPDGGTIIARGRVDLESEQLGYDMEVSTVLFNANLLAETAPVTSLTGLLRATGRGVEPATMQADLFAIISTSTLDTVAVDSARVRVRIANGMADIDTLNIGAPGTRISALGTFGLSETARGSLAYDVAVDSMRGLARYLPRDTAIVLPRPSILAERIARARADSLAEAQRLRVARAAGVAPPAAPIRVDSIPSVRRDELSGSVRALGSIEGGLGGFDVRGDANAEKLVVLGNSVRVARAKYTWLGVLTDSAIASGEISADTVSASGFALDSVSVKATYRAPGGTAEVAVFQDDTREYSIAANYALYADSSELLLNRVRMRFDTTLWASAREGAVRWGQPGIVVDSIDLRSGATGRLFVNGRVPTEGDADLEVVVERFQLGDLLGLLQSDLPGRGLLSLKSSVAGTGDAPVISGNTSLTEAMYAGDTVPDVRSTFDYKNLQLTARADATYFAHEVARADAVIPINLALKADSASRLIDAPATANVRLDSLPLDLASRFTDAVSQIEGYAKGEASLRGTLKEPELTGDLDVALGSGRINALGVTFRDITGTLRLQGDTVLLDSLTARSRGAIGLRGGIGIAKIAEPSFDLRLTADNARILDNETGRVDANADIRIEGPFNAVVVNGTARIREGVLYIPETSTATAITASDPAVFAVVDTTNEAQTDLVPERSALMDNLRMDLRLSVDRNTWVRSAEANVEIYSDGNLRIVVDQRRRALALDGVVNTDRGEYEFLSKRFQIKRGTATFIGTEELDPLLQLTGEFEVKQASQQTLDVRVNIGGTMLSPRITLESDAQPPISQSDLLSYLAFGSESGSLLQFGGSSVSGGTAGGSLVGTSAALATRQLASVALGVAVNELEGRASRSLGADVFNITPANVPTELASGNFGAFETFLKGTQFEFGKYVSSGTFVGLQTQLSSVPGFRIEHRFRRNPGFSIESTFQPRFFLPDPSLTQQELRRAHALGFFLTRLWRF